MQNRREKIKVLVVDDSALMRKLIPMIISADENIEVIGTAMDGDFALNKLPQLRPDVITLDIDMPRMNGLATLKSVVRNFNIPVILVSSLTRDGAGITLKGLEMGAFDFVPKPKNVISSRIFEISANLISKIKAAAESKSCVQYNEPVEARKKPQRVVSMSSGGSLLKGVVAIGISTGGPQALTEILPKLPADFPLGILIVQHMPETFTGLFAQRLDSICNIEVKEAENGDIVRPGLALLAHGGKHLKVKKTPLGLLSILSQGAPVSGHRPSVTVLFNSVAEEFGSNAIGVIMTGMGEDGVEGLRSIKEKGGITIAQDEASAVVYGMPKTAFEKGYADEVLGLHEIIPELMRLTEIYAMQNTAGKVAVPVSAQA